MNRKLRFIGAALAALLVLAPGAVHAQDIDQALEGLKTYAFGDSRVALTAVEEAAVNAKTDPALKEKLETAFIDLLGSEASVDAKRFACRQLAVMGTGASVDILAGLIDEEGLADYAIKALVAIPHESALAALEQAIAETPQTQKIAIVNALGRRGSEDAVEPLTKLLDSPDKALVQAATAALGGIGGSGCTELLARLEEKGAGAGTVLADACLQCAQWMPDGQADQALKIYNTLYDPAQPGYIRAAALGGLVRLEPEKARERVVEALAKDDPNLTLVAGGFIRDLPGEEVTETFAGMIEGAPPRTQILLIDALAHRGDPGALDAVTAAAGSDNEAVQLAALNALGQLGNHDSIPRLLELAANASGDVQRTARASLASIPGQRTDVATLNVAREGEGAVQLEAIRTLAGRRALRTTPALLNFAEADDPAVRAEALSALRVLAGEEDMGALLDLLAAAADDTQRKNVAQAIVDLAGRIRAPRAKTAPARHALAQATDDPTRAALIGILGRIPTDESLAVLREQVQTGNAALKTAAVNALAEWPDTRPLDDLKQLARNADDPVRSVAFAGYIRQLRAADDLKPEEKFAAYKAADEMAASDQEKKLVVAGLAEVPSLAALEYVEARQQDPAVAAEATQAVIRIAGAISGTYPAQVSQRMNAYIQQDTSEAVKKQAQNVLNGIKGYGDYITAWQYAGPYFEEGKPATSIFDTAFPPESDPGSVTWSIAPMGLDPAQPWKVHLARIIGGEERVAYLRTTITSETEREIVLELGTNDGCKVWWNGEQIHSLNTGRTLTPGEDQLPATLQEGENTLLIAVYQHGGDWAAAARLRTKDGEPVSGVTSSAK